MKGIMDFLFLGAVTVLIVGSAQLLALDIRKQRFVAEEQLQSARQNREKMSRRLTELESALQSSPTTQIPAFIATDELEAELALQESVLSIAQKHGITPLRFGTGPVSAPTNHPTLGFEIEFEAGLHAASAFLESLETSSPPLSLNDLWIRQLPEGSLGDEMAPLSIRIAMWAFWSGSVDQ